MPQLNPIDPASAPRLAGDPLAQVKAKLGRTPNMMRTMAASPAVLKAYLAMSEALGAGHLPTAIREQIAFAVGEANGCHYCVSAHAAIGKKVGLPDNQILAAREGRADDPRAAAAVRVARDLVRQHGSVSDADVERLRAAGYGDAESAEIVAAVALNRFTNYFNLVAGVEVDFPRVGLLGRAEESLHVRR